MGQLADLGYLSLVETSLEGPLPLSLTNLTALGSLFFQRTNLCELPDESFQSWLGGVETVVSAGTCAPNFVETTERQVVADEAIAFNPITSAFPAPSLTLVSGPSGMTLDEGSLRWTPPADSYGWSEFELKAENEYGATSDTLALWVNAVPQETPVHETGRVTATVSNDGSFGATYDTTTFALDGENALFDGTLVLGRSADQVSGELFEPAFGIRSSVQSIESGLMGFDEAREARYDDRRGSGPDDDPLGVTVTQRTHSKSTAPDRGYVIVEYKIENTSGARFDSLYVGMEMDWDVGELGSNLGDYDAGRRLSYVYEAASSDREGADDTSRRTGGPLKATSRAARGARSDQVTAASSSQNDGYYGMTALTEPVSGQAVWSNEPSRHTEAAYFERLTTFAATPTEATDQRASLATGPHALASDTSVTVRFAVVGGSDLADLRANADAARTVFEVPPTPTAEDSLSLSLGRNTESASDTLGLSNAGTAPLDYEADWSASWLSAEPSSGSIAPGDSSDVTVSVDASALSPGTYRDTMRLTLRTSSDDAGKKQDAATSERTVAVPVSATVDDDVGVDRTKGVPQEYTLRPAYPNPVRRAATLRYGLPEAAQVQIHVYDVLGRRVATLADAQRPAGWHEVRVDAAQLPAGVYLYRLTAGSYTETRRMVVVR
jgi:hypothetical protein